MIAFSLALIRRLFRGGTGYDTVDGLFHLAGCDCFLAVSGSEDRGFVDEVGEVCTTESRSLLGQDFHVHILGHRFALGVNGEDFAPAIDVRQVQDYAPVEAAGAEEGGVQDVRAVGCGEDDDVGRRVEAIHLDQDLVQGLLPLVVPAPRDPPPR